MATPQDIRKISDTIWEIPASHKQGMRVPARIYATEKLLKDMDDGVIDQVTNVATLPGILKYAFCMPDGHWGYGFPIGGVAAMDKETGVTFKALMNALARAGSPASTMTISSDLLPVENCCSYTSCALEESVSFGMNDEALYCR
jgi:hypothetical protein